MNVILGWLLISLPFIGLNVYFIKTEGLQFALTVFGLAALIIIPIMIGSHLLFE